MNMSIIMKPHILLCPQNKIFSRYHNLVIFSRLFVEGVMTETLSELIQNCTFKVLTDAVNTQKERKAQLQETILKYDNNIIYFMLR